MRREAFARMLAIAPLARASTFSSRVTDGTTGILTVDFVEFDHSTCTEQ